MRVVVRARDELGRVPPRVDGVTFGILHRWRVGSARQAGSAARPAGCVPRRPPRRRPCRPRTRAAATLCSRGSVAGGLGVPVAERVAVALRPLVRAVGQLRSVAGLDQPVVAGVVERAQHAGDVAQRRVERAGARHGGHRLALEVDEHPAVRRCAAPGRGAGRRGCAARSRRRRGRRRRRRASVQRRPRHRRVGHDRRRPRSSRGAHRRRARSRSSSRPSLPVPKAAGEVGVHLGDGGAEPLGLAGEVAAGLVGVQVGLGHQVADAGLGQLPAVGGRGHELLQHRQRVRLAVDVGLDGAEQPRHVAWRRARVSAAPISMSG